MFLMDPQCLNSYFTSFFVAWNARFFTINLGKLAYSFDIFYFNYFIFSYLCESDVLFDTERINLWPSKIWLCNFLITLIASSLEANQANPQPIDLPVLSLMIVVDLGTQILDKNSSKTASSVWKFKFFIQITFDNSSASIIYFSTFYIYFSNFCSVSIPIGAISKQRKLFLNLVSCSFQIALIANSLVEYQTIAIALFGANKTLFTIPQKSNSSLSSPSVVLQFRFFTNNTFYDLQHKFRSNFKNSTFKPWLIIHYFVYWITQAQANATLGARSYDTNISDFQTPNLADILSRIVLGLRNSVFHVVVSWSFYLISRFFFFWYELFSSFISPYNQVFFCSYSASFPILIISPISCAAGLTCRILPKSTLLSVYEKALKASSGNQQVTKAQPFALPSYYTGTFTFLTFPNLLNYFLTQSSVMLYGMLVTYSRVSSTVRGADTNFLFFQDIFGALIARGSYFLLI